MNQIHKLHNSPERGIAGNKASDVLATEVAAMHAPLTAQLSSAHTHLALSQVALRDLGQVSRKHVAPSMIALQEPEPKPSSCLCAWLSGSGGIFGSIRKVLSPVNELIEGGRTPVATSTDHWHTLLLYSNETITGTCDLSRIIQSEANHKHVH